MCLYILNILNIIEIIYSHIDHTLWSTFVLVLSSTILGESYPKADSYTSFEKFAEMLVLEHENLVNMGILQSSKTKALVANEGSSSGKTSNKKHK